ncbi:MAG: TrmH family RNA methyltransferase [Treponema sp.]|jgi:TrmH family RNA methyltransferase|nr:TrmH family RNA methyltransferase [Treponema sp.]
MADIIISLGKLEKLPRCQRLRKICRIFAEAETRMYGGTAGQSGGAVLTAAGCALYADIAGLLAGDLQFQPAAIEAFKTTALVLRQAADADALADMTAPRRYLNTMRHILLAEIGRSPADWDFVDAGGRLDPSRRRPFTGMLVYLEDIRSPFNVGAMFRAAESFGAEKIVLSPWCADPRHPRAERSAMGCVDALPWERRELFADRAAGAETSPVTGPVFALETGRTPLGAFSFPHRGLLIAGSEELGVSPSALAAADASLGRVSIPCYGAKGSLNVSVAFGIVMQAWTAALQAWKTAGNLCYGAF